ncbi:hypothetical protein [Sphingobacterium sp. SGL-16]|uniref:hypothetical protein n=1 Tax=Sphingobacterium sp. SGL-16 TaxID=2710883 RepID=UPI0013ED7887|nr:hypothetical protein [Sphingobacterium sp. SGL-16]NGM74275.1 hypothetical protein [Sphingobacterium sp. SGL-16]
MSLIIKEGKRKYVVPSIVLAECFAEESLCTSSATVTFGNPGQDFSPDIEDWNAGSQSNSTYEF